MGYPDFWNRASQLEGDFYRTISNVHPKLVEAMGFSEHLPLSKTVKTIAISVACTYSGVSILTLNGHGLDAMRLARAMFEGAVTAAYLVEEPAQLEPYLAYTKVSAKKLLDYMQLFPNSNHKFTPESAKKINEEYQAVRHLFPGKLERLPTRWSKLQIAQIFERVGLSTWYSGFYHLASSLVHMDMRGMYMQYGLDDNKEPNFRFPPSEDMLAQAHAAAKVAMHFAIKAYAKCTSDESTRDRLEKLADIVIAANGM